MSAVVGRRTRRGLVVCVFAFAMLVALSASGCGADRSDDDVLAEMDQVVAEKATEVSVFYPSADIIAEERAVVEGDSEDLPLETIRTLFRAQPSNPELRVTLPPAEVRSVKIEDGVATVDFDRDVIVTGEDETTQRTALASIIYTLKQFEGVEKVAFTVEGKQSGSIDGRDVGAFWGVVRIDDGPWDVAVNSSDQEGTE